MFLASLSYKQRKVFLGLAKEILTIDDGVMDNYEEDYLRSLCSEMSLSFNDELIVEKSEIKNYFNERESKKILLLELVALGHSNKEYHETQDKYTDEICNLVSIPMEELRDIENLFEQYNKIQNKFIEFIES
ncbi:MAG: hypothetical protein WC665_11575 [Sulfurimonas sp.]|jgi:hypothetical protein